MENSSLKSMLNVESTEGTNPRRRGWDFDCRLSRADSRWGNQCMVWSLRKSGCWMSLDIFDRFEPLLGTGYLVSPRQSLWQESKSFLVNQLVGSSSFSFPKLRLWQPHRHEILLRCWLEFWSSAVSLVEVCNSACRPLLVCWCDGV